MAARIQMQSNISIIGSVGGAVTGVLEGIDNGAYKTNFITSMMNAVERKFMADSIASKERIKHVFEWGDTAEEVSSEPLFKIIRAGSGTNRYMTYTFLPSHKYVPLPSAKFGISPKILSKLSRHVFTQKAIVMETRSIVHVSPSNEHGIFIPKMGARGGYIMSHSGGNPNPGGDKATGAFHEWWIEWMDSRAHEVVYDLSKKRETANGANGRKAIRDAAGRYSKGTKASFEYSRARAALYMMEDA